MVKLEVTPVWAAILRSVHVNDCIQCYVNYVSVFAAILQEHVNPELVRDSRRMSIINDSLEKLSASLEFTQRVNELDTYGMDRIRSMYHMSSVPKLMKRLMEDCGVQTFIGANEKIIQFLEQMELFINEPAS